MMKLNFLCLVLSFIIGLAYIYTLQPYKKIVIKRPNLEDKEDIYTTKNN